MGIYISARLEKDDAEIGPLFHANLIEGSCLMIALSRLIGSTRTPHEDWVNGWKIARIEDDPKGYLPLFFATNDAQEEAPIRSHEARIILDSIRKAGIQHIGDEQLAKVLSETFQRVDINGFEGNDDTGWFKNKLGELVKLLQIVAKTEGAYLDSC